MDQLAPPSSMYWLRRCLLLHPFEGQAKLDKVEKLEYVILILRLKYLIFFYKFKRDFRCLLRSRLDNPDHSFRAPKVVDF